MGVGPSESDSASVAATTAAGRHKGELRIALALTGTFTVLEVIGAF